MNPDNTVEYNSLSWVKAQLDDVLTEAQSNLNEYIENQEKESLERCIENLQLIYGTLQMVEVYGAAMLAEEMQQTSQALLEGRIDRDEDAYDVLMRAMLQLPDYLEGIQAGKSDTPITLMPLINDLRAARKEGLLTESALFSPDIESAELVSDEHDTQDIESGKLQAEAKRLRTHYQLGLLDYIRNNKEQAGLKRIRAVLNSLVKVSAEAEVQRLWMVVSALAEGLMKEGINANLSIKMLMGAVDRQLKLLIDVGEEAFVKDYSRELVTNMLYYIGTCDVESDTINAVKDAYHLDDLMPHDDEAAGTVGGLNADLFDTVSKGISEDLGQVKDVLELYMHSAEPDLAQLEPVAEQLVRIADTYGMLGMGAIRQSVMNQADVIKKIVAGEEQASETVVLGIASELLNAESELKDFIASRSGFVDMNRKGGDENVPSAEYRQVVFAVVSEALKNFSDAKEAVLSYISGSGDKDQLEIILQRLEEVRGVAMMLPLGRVESQIVKLQNYVQTALLNNNHRPDDQEQDTVADVVTSIEYFLEALSEGRPGVEQGLNAGDAAAAKLEEVTLRYGGEPGQEQDESDALTAGEEAPEDRTEEQDLAVEEEPATLSEPVEEPATEAAATEAATAEAGDQPALAEAETAGEAAEVENYNILADDADEEIVEIFIEEAVEVLGELHNYLPQWKANHEDEEALAVVRRSFHTLKGSGRLLGAELIGEFSWKFENMLNKVIDNKINVTDALLNALDEALAVLPQLIEQLKGNREPVENIAQLMSVADALARGEEAVLETAAPADEIVAEPEEKPAEEAGIEELSADTDDIEVAGLDETALEETVIVSEVDDEAADEVEEISLDSMAGEEEDEFAYQQADDEISIETVSLDESGTDEPGTDEIEIEEMDIVIDDSMLDTGGIEEIAITSDEQEEEPGSFDEEAFTDEAAVAPESMAPGEAEEAGVDDSEEEIVSLSVEDDEGNEFSIEIDELDTAEAPAADELDIDPMLLKIYHDESLSHLEEVRRLLDESRQQQQALKADKALMRAFHTLYGSARTAEVDAIAELSGAAEKYIKARQDGHEEAIPEDVTEVIAEIEQAISGMLAQVLEGRQPASNRELHDRINRLVQKEIQSQLQQSWRDSTTPAANQQPETGQPESDEMSIDMGELAPETDDTAGIAEEPVEEAGPVENGQDTSAVDEHAVAEDLEQGVSESAQAVEISYGDIDQELIEIFLEEADELLESCERTLEELRQAPNSTEHIHQLQRNMHTLKGGARMADLTPVGDLTHNLESLVVLVNENKIAADKALFDVLQESVDVLTGMLADVRKLRPLTPADELNRRIDMMMRGEVEEKRAVERFDLDIDDLDGEDEELEDIDISQLLPRKDESDETVVKLAPEREQTSEPPAQRDEAAERQDDRPHWGERATDVNFKESREQIRVRSDLLNNLVNYAGEVNIYHARLGKQISDFSFNLSELTATVVRLKEQLRKLEIETEIQIRSGYEKEGGNYDENFDPLEMDQYSTLQQLTRSLSETAGDVESINEILTEITRDSETLLLQEARVSTDLQEGLMRTRMVRFGGLSSRLRRIARQVARELGKEVQLKIIGEESEVDRTVLDRIIAPLEHLLRNAIAHGIETPEQRRAAGKDETGTITIEVSRQGTDVVINVKDDGAGMDVDRIRSKAVQQGLIKADANLSDRDVLQCILMSGFSTAESVTQVSGRGVGMDVVDSEIKQLGGVLDISTEVGKGSSFNIRLPLTLAINQALLVSAADDVFAVPLASIEGVLRITGLELQRFYDSGNTHYEFNGVEYTLMHLGNLLTGKQPDYSKQLRLFPLLLVNVGDQHFALHVDDLLGRREIVVKPVGLQIGAVRGVAGATILADGRVVLILEMSALVMGEGLFQPHEPIEEEEVEEVAEDIKTIMVVDDSITIRKVTERMLQRYGINVILAKDGVDATNQLQDHIPDLMLLDIEMPHMDGFEVATFVRNEDRLKDIPIIMITSRTGSKHKDKAMKIGVNRYLGKPFQEEDLLNNINEILQTAY
ncbi:MAG TPA: hybrid sensor histidine kinase/response regulator [Gammaproteobacteria bacterium]|nr:hybrid sensor histidine kinase/response regulator [Gammaproteobacteria bacterium]